MTIVTTRRLAHGHMPVMRELLDLFGRGAGDMPSCTPGHPEDAYLTDLLRSTTFIALVAEDGATVVGGLAAYVLPKSEHERCEVYMYELAVADEYRRRGIATVLIEHLRQEARDLGAHGIHVPSDGGDAAVSALHAKFGIREDVMPFDIGPRESALRPGRPWLVEARP